MNYTKPFWRSREVWTLGTAVLLGLAEFLGVDFQGTLGSAQNIWLGVAPVIALVLRLFFTKTKLTFK